MTTRLFLIRHGATVLAAEDRFAGSIDVELSAEGRGQAERLAERLASDEIAAFYCSPMKRTVETASIVARPHALTPIVRDSRGRRRHSPARTAPQRRRRRRVAPLFGAASERDQGVRVDGRTGRYQVERRAAVERHVQIQGRYSGNCQPG